MDGCIDKKDGWIQGVMMSYINSFYRSIMSQDDIPTTDLSGEQVSIFCRCNFVSHSNRYMQQSLIS